jgi:hypothetical protein
VSILLATPASYAPAPNTRFPGLSIAPAAVAPIVASVVGDLFGGGAKRAERNIQDRMQRWQSFPSDQLREIIRSQGGEAGEAARRLLEARGEPVTAPAPPVASASPVLVLNPPTTTAPVTTQGATLAGINPIIAIAALGAAVLLLGRR